MKGELKGLGASLVEVGPVSEESHEGRIESNQKRPKSEEKKSESHEGRIESGVCHYLYPHLDHPESHEGRIESSTTLLDVSYLA